MGLVQMVSEEYFSHFLFVFVFLRSPLFFSVFFVCLRFFLILSDRNSERKMAL